MKQMIETMLNLQDAMNAKVNPDWRSAGNKWSDAIMVEAVEAFDYTSWKWWKDTSAEPDWKQIRMELVDIWHFVLSALMEQYSIEEISGMVEEYIPRCASMYAEKPAAARPVEVLKTSLRSIIEDSAPGSVVAIKSILPALIMSGITCELPFHEVYRLYLAKNTLNLFRQDHGYKQGTYVKIWNGREDNEVLTEIVEGMSLEQLTFKNVYTELGAAYTLATINNKVKVESQPTSTSVPMEHITSPVSSEVEVYEGGGV